MLGLSSLGSFDMMQGEGGDVEEREKLSRKDQYSLLLGANFSSRQQNNESQEEKALSPFHFFYSFPFLKPK